ncbi:formyl transferase, partial [Mesorhizobium sp. M0029]
YCVMWRRAGVELKIFATPVKLLPAGVYTGGVLKQARGKPEPGDTISSYALRQAAFSRDICVEAVRGALDGKLATIKPDLPSKQWYHPTIWFYLWTGVRRGVW